MLRASVAAEAAGVPSSTLVCDGFLGLASLPRRFKEMGVDAVVSGMGC